MTQDWPPDIDHDRGERMRASGFGSELLFIKYVDDSEGYSGPSTSWVSSCPEGVDPRSEENPHVYTWRETWEDGWHLRAERNQWYVVGARTGRWIGLDFDVGEDHEETIDFDLDDLGFPANGAQIAVTKSGGLHLYFLLDSESPPVKTELAGVDLMGDHQNFMLRGAMSPWHDERRGLVNDASPIPVDDKLDPEDYAGFVSVDGEPVLLEELESDPLVELDIPDDSPEDTPLCVHQLLNVRSSQARYSYPDSPFAADSHLGMMLCAVGYSKDEAASLLRDNPPAKDTGYDHAETMYQLEMLYSKMRDGDMQPPNKKLLKAGIDVKSCNCSIHGIGRDAEGSMEVPEAISREQQSRRDRVALNNAKSDVRRTLSNTLEGGLIYHAPQGLGKTKYTPYGAEDQPRLVITTNKGAHRETIEWAAGQAGVTVGEIIPFGDSWLASDMSPVQDEVLDLYHRGVMPKYILNEYGEVMDDDIECPYIEQFEGDAPEVDVLMGSPGHENVKRFRSYPGEGEDEVKPRAVVYDDVSPGDHEINQNIFTIDEARAGLNELIQEIPELESRSVTELMSNQADQRRVERLAVGDEEEEENPEPAEQGDVWSALEATDAEGDAINIDLVDIMLNRQNVTGENVIQLKVICGAEIRNVKSFEWESGDKTYNCWVNHPDLANNDVAILSATHVPHVTEQWMSGANAGPAIHRSATDDWKAVRRAQGYTLIQTRDTRNSRSGGGSFHDDPAARKANMQETRDELSDAIERAEGQYPGVIDSKKLIDDDDMMNFARVWSNNRFRDKTVGLVSGATYYGDEYVEARAAYCGRDIDINHEPGKKADCDDEIGSDLLQFMVVTAVEQAVTRFGRSGTDNTRVYVDTAEVPPDFPTIDVSDRIIRLNSTQKDVLESVRDGADSIKDIEAEVTDRQIGNICWELEEMGFLDIQPFALENGRHEVSGSSGILSIQTVNLPEISHSGLERSDAISDGDRTYAEASLEVDGDGLTEEDGYIIPGSDDERDPPDTRQARLQ